MSQRVVVVGQGYVGLPLAMAAAGAGHSVVGVDADQARVDALNAGTPAGDVAGEELAAALAAGTYRADAGFEAVAHADVVVVCVPTPMADEAPDLSHVQSAGRALGQVLRAGTLVVLESTSYPGTTDEVFAPLLLEASGLAPGELDVAFSPERIDPGNPVFALANTPKVVGASTEQARDRAAAFYETFVETVVPVSSAGTAEMAKLLENTFRHINIALANEMAVICRALGLDVWEVIEAAATKPFGFMPFWPGPGVGGHCFPVDPMYLSWKVRQHGGASRFIALARDVNAGMPAYVVSRVQELLNDVGKAVRGARVLVVGVTYKPDVADLRETPALDVIAGLRRLGADVVFSDPFVPELTVGGEALRRWDGAGVDLALVLVAHSAVDHEVLVGGLELVLDCRDVLPRGGSNVHRL